MGPEVPFLVCIINVGLYKAFAGLLTEFSTRSMICIRCCRARLLQGLALGGEYGGAATCVAEHAPNGRRGLHELDPYHATVGLMLALMVILTLAFLAGGGAFTPEGEKAFSGEWGALALAVRCSRACCSASPSGFASSSRVARASLKMKAEGKSSKAPIAEAFGQWKNLRIVLLALFGLTAGQAVVWYTGQFYALYFLQTFLKVDGPTANILIAVALILGTPFFVFFGSLSDRVGRKPIIMAGCLIAP